MMASGRIPAGMSIERKRFEPGWMKMGKVEGERNNQQ
jgi:hypothetical protein